MTYAKACPFCAEQVAEELDVVAAGFESRFVAVQCPCCAAQGPAADTAEGARRAWDFRYTPPVTTEESP